MTDSTFEARSKQQRHFDLNFGRSVMALTGAEDLYRCIQCGTCSSTCPLSAYMDHSPRRIIAMTRAGLKDEVLSSNTIWLCSSCYSCSVACPKQIRITDVMYSLKRRAIQSRRFSMGPVAALARAFIGSVMRTGRSNEARIILRAWLVTRPREILRQGWLGFRLWLKGRLSLRVHRMTGQTRDLRRLLGNLHDSPTYNRKA